MICRAVPRLALTRRLRGLLQSPLLMLVNNRAAARTPDQDRLFALPGWGDLQSCAGRARAWLVSRTPTSIDGALLEQPHLR